jgi:hypothetical protein
MQYFEQCVRRKNNNNNKGKLRPALYVRTNATQVKTHFTSSKNHPLQKWWFWMVEVLSWQK